MDVGSNHLGETAMRKNNSCYRSFGEILSQFVTPEVWKQAHQAWWQQHWPSRWQLKPLVWVVLCMAWCCGDSQEERWATARMVYVAAHQRERQPGKTLAGFLDALERLPLPVLRALGRGVRAKLGEEFVAALRIKGWLPMA